MFTKEGIYAVVMGGLNKFTKDIVEYIDVEWVSALVMGYYIFH